MGKGNGGSMIYSFSEEGGQRQKYRDKYREEQKGREIEEFYRDLFIISASVVVHKHQTEREHTEIYRIIEYGPYKKTSPLKVYFK